MTAKGYTSWPDFLELRKKYNFLRLDQEGNSEFKIPRSKPLKQQQIYDLEKQTIVSEASLEPLSQQNVSLSQFLIDNKEKLSNKDLILSQSNMLKNVNKNEQKLLSNTPQPTISEQENLLPLSSQDANLISISSKLLQLLDGIEYLKSDFKDIQTNLRDVKNNAIFIYIRYRYI